MRPSKPNYSCENKPVENVLWFGTSISKSLDKNRIENDLNINLKIVRAYGIECENNQRFPHMNFTDTVPKALVNENPDAIVLQGGSIEITNNDVSLLDYINKE